MVHLFSDLEFESLLLATKATWFRVTETITDCWYKTGCEPWSPEPHACFRGYNITLTLPSHLRDNSHYSHNQKRSIHFIELVNDMHRHYFTAFFTTAVLYLSPAKME